MNPIVKLAWHFGGLAMVLTGVTLLLGSPGFLIGLGLWAMLGTAFDAAMEKGKT